MSADTPVARESYRVKLKRIPDDFRVIELTDFAPGGGPFALYRLTKRSLGTPEVIDAVCRRWNIARRQVAFGGLKDRHAVTQQFVTIARGPRHTLKQTNFELAYLGQAARAFQSGDIAGNRFRIVMRDMSQAAVERSAAALNDLSRDGLPNYFDDQRFGSLGASGEFVARPWCQGNYERALWLALADPNEHDRPDEREQKRRLRELWGDWPACKAALGRSHRRSIVSFLYDRPGDFRGAIARIRVDLRSLYLAAFQSYLWNRLLQALLQECCRPDQLIPVTLDVGVMSFFSALDDVQRARLASTLLPLPTARTRLEDGPIKQLVDRTLAEFGLEMRQLRIKYPRDSFFSKGNRPALFVPQSVCHQTGDDDLYPGRHTLTLAFDLPRGSYATILIKGISVRGRQNEPRRHREQEED